LGYLRVAGVACALVLGLCPAASAAAATARSDALPVTVIDNFHTGQSRTEVTGSQPSLLSAGSSQAALAGLTPAEEGPRKVAVLLMNVPGSFGGTWSPEETRSKVFTASHSANAFYEEESYGEISLTGKSRSDGDVFGWFTLAPKSSGCPYEEWDDEADHLAEAAGVDLSGYQHIVYISTLQPSCSWSGIADVSGTRANINGNAASGVIAHELGHNLGLEHAGSWTCTEGGVRVQISATCTTSEYGDPFDTMGSASANRHNNGLSLSKLGILGPGNVETATESGVYSIRSALNKTNEPTVLRIARKRSPTHSVTSWYYLEIRQAGGVFESSSDASTTGVSIRATVQGAYAEKTLLLDANPSTATFADAPLQPGEVFDGGRVQIKTLSAGAGKATVDVQLNTQPPAAPDDLQATVSADGVQLDWTDSDSAEVKRYFVYRDGEQVGNIFTPSFLDFRPLAGEHEYVVIAEDEEENRSDPSAPLTVNVPVVSGPTCSQGSCKVAFRYSGASAAWTVPPGVGEALVTAEGARGGGHAMAPERSGGYGVRIWATLGPLAPGQTAAISVGGRGRSYSEGSAGGFNGGGSGGHGGGGGGYTKLELDSTLEVLAAGGGGGGLDGHNGSLLVTGGRGGDGGEQGVAGTRGAQTLAAGATLKGGTGGAGGGTGDAGGEGGQVVGATTCEGGATAGVSGAAGSSLTGGGGVAEAGGGGGGGYVGGGQGGAGASDACGDKAASGGGGGGSSFVVPGHLQDSESAGDGDGWLGIEYDDPIIAAAGEYTTFGGQELNVSATAGVLAGSSSPEPGPLTASLVDPPANGFLTLEPDGSFTYIPDPGFLGSDSFVYRAGADAAGDYAEATVVLNVAGPPSAAISSPSPAGTYVIGQAVKTAFSCSDGLGGPGLLSCDDSNGTTSATGGTGHLDTVTVGHHTYSVTAVSKDGLTGETSFGYEVLPAPPPGEETPGDPPRGGPAPPGGPAPGSPETGRPEIEFPSPAARGSLRELLRTGRLDVRVRLGGAAKLVLNGRAKLRPGAAPSARPKLVKVLGSKSVSFAAAGERTIALILTQKGRRALRHLSAVSLVISVEATAAAGEKARKSWPLLLGA
jgi:Bacterial Ig domain/Gametolysin peptidase M11